jgi:hypothetical protein
VGTEAFMRVAFFSLPVPGHLNPMMALARKLQARGRAVVFLRRELLDNQRVAFSVA